MRSVVLHVAAFLRGELVATLRQPRLLLILVLGPFLVLFVFGLGYEERLPPLTTLVVGAQGELTDRVDALIREEQPVEIVYEGTTDDEEQALERLRAGEVDLVLVLPDGAMETLGSDEQAVLEVHQRSLDPITSTRILVASRIAVGEINDRLLEEALESLQDEVDPYGGLVERARGQLDSLRAALDEQDVRLVRRTAGTLSTRLSELADLLEGAGGGLFGSGDDQLADTLRDGARQLDRLASLDASGELDEARSALEDLEATLDQLRSLDPGVAVRPFTVDVISQTPVDVTLNRFYAPGLVALMLQHVGITFAALALVRERATGTLEMLRVAPVTTGERLAGKSVAFLLLGGLLAVGLTALIVAVFDVPAPATWGPFAALVVLTLLASLGIGYVVAAVSDTDGQAVQFSMMLLLAAIFFSGLLMPLDRIGMPVEVVSWLLPATYGFAGLQQLMLLGQAASTGLFVGLAAIAAVTFAAARILLPRRPPT